MIKLSIIIPVYNVEHYIKQCLDSIFTEENATLPYEVIVVNDGTPDNSMVVVEEYVTKHPNLHVVRQKNQGQSVARNNGLEIAKGEYVWFVDSDDWIEPYSICTLISLMEQNPEIEIFAVPSTWKYDDPNKNWIDLKVDDNTIMTGKKYQESGFQMAAWQFVTKRSLLRDNNILFYPGIIHEDLFWGAEIMYISQHVMVIQQPLYCYRQRQEGSAMHNINIKSGYYIVKGHEQLMIFMNERVKEEDKVWFKKMHIFRIQEATWRIWNLRKTIEFKKFLKETKTYRYQVCNDCAKLGGWRWKLKCWLMKYPVENEYLRIIKKRIKEIFVCLLSRT